MTALSALSALSRTTARGLALAITAGATLLLAWGIGALGVIGAAGDPADRLYLPVFAIAVVGALVARLRSRGMAVVLLAMAVAQAVALGIALAAGLGGGKRLEIIGLNLMFMGMFVVAAWLFRHSAGPGSILRERGV